MLVKEAPLSPPARPCRRCEKPGTEAEWPGNLCFECIHTEPSQPLPTALTLVVQGLAELEVLGPSVRGREALASYSRALGLLRRAHDEVALQTRDAARAKRTHAA